MKEIDRILTDVDALVGVYGNPTLRHTLLDRIKDTCELIAGTMVEPDKGPWVSSPDGRIISSDNFDHDVSMNVRGDFANNAHRWAYSIAVCNRLNGAEQLPKGLPEAPPESLLYSMALRYRHDFGLEKPEGAGALQAGCTPSERAAILATMRQLYEEVAGHGFYRWS